jgi:hypothetical protein
VCVRIDDLDDVVIEAKNIEDAIDDKIDESIATENVEADSLTLSPPTGDADQVDSTTTARDSIDSLQRNANRQRSKAVSLQSRTLSFEQETRFRCCLQIDWFFVVVVVVLLENTF